MPEANDWTPKSFDKYLAAKVLLPHHEELVKVQMIHRKWRPDSNPEVKYT
jgi:hypothetical protein